MEVITMDDLTDREGNVAAHCQLLLGSLRGKLHNQLELIIQELTALEEQGDTYGGCCGSDYEGLWQSHYCYQKVLDFLDGKVSTFE
jgi:hypothetical protein|tara:strand:- start:47 stop:304 length:258 start_codon:yes stop_codon:yes gene_type:complete